MSRQTIHTNHAPQAIGPYSQAVRAGDTVYLSGQIPLDPETMQLVTGDIEAEIRQVFENLKAVAEAAGGSLANAVKVNVFLTDLVAFREGERDHGDLLHAALSGACGRRRCAVPAWRARRDRVRPVPWLNAVAKSVPAEAAAEQRPVTAMRGVGSALAEKLQRLGVTQVQDLLFVLPLRYEDRTRVVSIGALLPACGPPSKARFNSPRSHSASGASCCAGFRTARAF